MKHFLSLSIILSLWACSGSVNQPKNLISQEKMADIIVDLTVYEKANMQDLNNQTPIIAQSTLKKHNIKAKDFEESYIYYVSQNDVITNIYQKAQDKIMAMDAKAAIKIKQKETEKEKNKAGNPTGNLPY